MNWEPRNRKFGLDWGNEARSRARVSLSALVSSGKLSDHFVLARENCNLEVGIEFFDDDRENVKGTVLSFSPDLNKKKARVKRYLFGPETRYPINSIEQSIPDRKDGLYGADSSAVSKNSSLVGPSRNRMAKEREDSSSPARKHVPRIIKESISLRGASLLLPAFLSSVLFFSLHSLTSGERIFSCFSILRPLSAL